MKKFTLILIVTLIMLSLVPLQTSAQDIDMASLIYSMPGTVPNPENSEDVIKAFQAMMIKNTFLRQAFSGQSIYGDTQSQTPLGGLINEMIITRMAEQMAENDVLNMRSQILERLGESIPPGFEE